MLRHGVAGGGDGLAEHDLADVDADVGAGVDRLRDARRAGGELAVAFGAVAVELDVGEVDRQALGRLHGRQRRVDVAGHAQVAAVDVQRVRHAELVHRPRQRFMMRRGVTR